jgi:hypothetical protein
MTAASRAANRFVQRMAKIRPPCFRMLSID